MNGKVTVTKVGETAPVLKIGGTKKRVKHRTFPRSSLKVKPVADPAKPPPMKKSSRNHTIRLLTDKGVHNQRKTIRNRVAKMPDAVIIRIVTESKLLKNKDTPIKLMREMVEGGMIAGFISPE